MTDRRAELEKKKLKLQQLRELKQQRVQTKKDIELITSWTCPTSINNNSSNVNSLTNSLTLAGGGGGDIKDVDELLESIGIITNKTGNSASGRSNRSSLDLSSLTNNNNNISSSSNNNNNNNNYNNILNNNTIIEKSNDGHITFQKTTNQQLNISSFPPVLIAPKENVTYEKQTQTTNTASLTSTNSNDRGGPLDYYVIHWDEVLTYDDLGGEEEGDGSLFTVPASAYHHQQQSHNQTSRQQHSGNKNIGNNQRLPTVEMVRPAQTQDELAMKGELDDEAHGDKARKRLEYKEEERRHLMQTDSFRKFLDRAVRITERALSCADSMDILIDYTGQVEYVDSEDKSGLRLSLNTSFIDDRWSRGRTITSFDWCTQFPELLVASYNQNDQAPNEPDGVCLVWNMKFKKSTPEYVFHCQSPVMSASFAKFHPNLILGGTYSGQIVLWDNRSGKRVPVQRSPLSASAHTHPVYSLKVVGTPNSHNLISISNDGKLCSWSLDMLSSPQETMELCQQKQSRLIAVTSMSFPMADYNNFILGSQEGDVYSACRHGAKAGILDVFDGHQGPVTAVDFHLAASPQIDFSHLFLTSSFDWTFKLWSMRDQTKLLYSFEDGSDYLYDIRWSPIHPALFATVDGLGKLDIWNLNQDTELPTVTTQVEGYPALNRLIWSPNGQQIVVGDDHGKIWVYDVGEQSAFPKTDEWTRFAHTLQEFTNNNADL